MRRGALSSLPLVTTSVTSHARRTEDQYPSGNSPIRATTPSLRSNLSPERQRFISAEQAANDFMAGVRRGGEAQTSAV